MKSILMFMIWTCYRWQPVLYIICAPAHTIHFNRYSCCIRRFKVKASWFICTLHKWLFSVECHNRRGPCLLRKSKMTGSNPTMVFKFQRNKMFLPRSLVKIQYCGEPPWPRGSVLGLRPRGLEFRIMCLEGSVISFISPSSGVTPGPL